MASFTLLAPSVYVEIGGLGAAGGCASGGGNGACGSGGVGGGACGSVGVPGNGSGGGSGFGAHAHGLSDPGHSHGLEEFTRAMTQAIAQSMTMPPMELQPAANYLACENAFVVRDIDQRFSWQNE